LVRAGKEIPSAQRDMTKRRKFLLGGGSREEGKKRGDRIPIREKGPDREKRGEGLLLSCCRGRGERKKGVFLFPGTK